MLGLQGRPSINPASLVSSRHLCLHLYSPPKFALNLDKWVEQEIEVCTQLPQYRIKWLIYEKYVRRRKVRERPFEETNILESIFIDRLEGVGILEVAYLIM